MKKLNNLSNDRRRNHMKFLKRIQEKGFKYTCKRYEMRMALRLQEEGKVTVMVSRVNLFYTSVREVCIFISEAEAKSSRYKTKLKYR